MGYTTTNHFAAIIRRHIRSGRASSKTEVVHQALALLDAVTRAKGPEAAAFRQCGRTGGGASGRRARHANEARAQGPQLWWTQANPRTASPETDDDLIAARDNIRADNDRAARRFLDTAFDACARVAQFPELGMKARLRPSALKAVRFLVLPPPFNRWLIFYEPLPTGGVYVRRVWYGTMNWRDEPGLCF